MDDDITTRIRNRIHDAPLDTERLLDDSLAAIERLRAGIQAMIDGNYPHPRSYRHETGKCPHGAWYYDDCCQCNDEWLTKLLRRNAA